MMSQTRSTSLSHPVRLSECLAVSVARFLQSFFLCCSRLFSACVLGSLCLSHHIRLTNLVFFFMTFSKEIETVLFHYSVVMNAAHLTFKLSKAEVIILVIENKSMYQCHQLFSLSVNLLPTFPSLPLYLSIYFSVFVHFVFIYRSFANFLQLSIITK